MEMYDKPPIEFIRVGFGKRLMAAVIDWLILMTLSIAASILFMSLDVPISGVLRESVDGIVAMYRIIGISESTIDSITGLLAGVMAGAFVLSIAFPLIEGITGASPGKRVLRITVAQPDGSRGSVGLFLRRYLIKNVSAVLQVVALLPGLAFIEYVGTILSVVIFFGCFMVLGTARMALHDVIAQTAVFHTDDVA